MNSQVKVVATIPVHEIGGMAPTVEEDASLRIESHSVENGYSRSLIVLTAPDGETFSVIAEELIHSAKICVGLPS